MKRFLLGLLLALILILAPVSAVMAATTAGVTVTATPSYISITNAPTSYNFGLVPAGGTPATGDEYFTITNTSSVSTWIMIQAETWWSATSVWTWGATGADQGKMAASDNDTAYDVDIAAAATSYNLTTVQLPAGVNQKWELKLIAPSSFTHGVVQTSNVTITAVQA